MTVDVTLEPRDPAALASYATAVATPGSSIYRQYLAPGAFPSAFGPTAATIDSVAQWLRQQGLRSSAISSDHLLFQVKANAAQLEHAFSVELFRYDIGGRIAYANTAAPIFGGAVAGTIQGVVGLDDLTLPQHWSILSSRKSLTPRNNPHVVTGGPQPCSAAISTGEEEDAYTADQLASAYQFSGLYGAGDLGTGQTVAIFEQEPNLTSDISAYQSCYDTNASVTYTKVDGGVGTGPGAGEAALDIEDVIGLVPNAKIDVYQAPSSSTGTIDEYNKIVTQDEAKVISTSWGECESESGSAVTSEENTIFEEAAAQGQSIFAASGNSGSEDCGTNGALTVDDPASQPYVTGVGGTTLTTLGPPPSQTVWNDSSEHEGAGGGGISKEWTMPSYQSGAPTSLNVVNADSSASPCTAAPGSYCREVPDVSADADPSTAYVIYYDGSWTSDAGTSAAAPLWAALMALTNASARCAGTPVGFANPALYKIAGSSSYSNSFSDITVGNNDYTPSGYAGGLFPAGTGYDMASGLGTPIGSGLSEALCPAATTVAASNPGPQKSTVGKKVKLQVKATDSGGLSLTYSSSGLPSGLSLNASSGLVTGKPTAAGKSTVTVTATDPSGSTGSASFSWKVVKP